MASSSSSTTPETCGDDLATWTNSVVWKSFETQEREKFTRFRQYRDLDVSTSKKVATGPYTFNDYINNRLNTLQDNIETLKLTIAAKEKRSRAQKTTSIKIMLAFGGRDLDDATRLIGIMMEPITVEDILHSGDYDSDLEFSSKAEFYLGAGLLKEL